MLKDFFKKMGSFPPRSIGKRLRLQFNPPITLQLLPVGAKYRGDSQVKGDGYGDYG